MTDAEQGRDWRAALGAYTEQRYRELQHFRNKKASAPYPPDSDDARLLDRLYTGHRIALVSLLVTATADDLVTCHTLDLYVGILFYNRIYEGDWWRYDRDLRVFQNASDTILRAWSEILGYAESVHTWTEQVVGYRFSRAEEAMHAVLAPAPVYGPLDPVSVEKWRDRLAQPMSDAVAATVAMVRAGTSMAQIDGRFPRLFPELCP